MTARTPIVRPRRLLYLGLIPLAGLLAAACGSSGPSSSATTTTTTSATQTTSASSATTSAAAPDVTTAKVGNLGSVLTNNQGQVLYTFTTGAGASVPCNASCLAVWPAATVPASTTTPTGRSGVGTLGITTMNGVRQITVNGLALYTYAGDASPDVADGNNLVSFGGTWKVVKVSG